MTGELAREPHAEECEATESGDGEKVSAKIGLVSKCWNRRGIVGR